ncbi:hypothetical protein MNSC_03030 [Minisyncoccus archaeophilus]|nr:MAG: hypothetical protein BWY21_00201 [Parcubacteria group bacterium ADurb.Bin216]
MDLPQEREVFDNFKQYGILHNKRKTKRVRKRI